MGYEKITLAPGLNMVGNQFMAVGTSSFQNINQMFKDQNGMVAGTGDSDADSILTWDGSSYSDIYYLDDYTEPYEWYNTKDIDNATTDTATLGQGFWFKHQGNTTITTTLAGEVPTNATVQIQIQPGLNFIANPYPMAICPNSAFFMVEGAIAGTGDSDADSILTWDGSSYSDIYYLDDYTEPYEWYNTKDIDNAVSTAILKPAMGFWYKHQGPGATLTFGKPY